MKRTAALLAAILLMLSLSACAGKQDGDMTRVKCPACGYEFDAPQEAP